MNNYEEPKITMDDISSMNTEVSGGRVQVDIEFDSKTSFKENFKAMTEKISDETLIEILKARNSDYIAEDYQ